MLLYFLCRNALALYGKDVSSELMLQQTGRPALMIHRTSLCPESGSFSRKQQRPTSKWSLAASPSGEPLSARQ